MLDLSIIIVSYNTRDLLRGCLSSVITGLGAGREGNPISSWEVFVVDNASQDGSPEMVASSFPRVRLIQNQENRGFAAANNQAIAQARGRYILLLNPDTLVLGDALQALFTFLESHPGLGAVGPKLLNPDGTFQHGAFMFPNLWMSFFDFFPINHRLINSRLNGRYPRQAYAAPFPIDHPLGACLLVRRDSLQEVGPFDEGFFLYCEEVDLCLRLKRAGWPIYCVPLAQVIHHVGQSTRLVREAMFVELHRSRFRLFRKHYSPLFLRAARQITRLGLWGEGLRSWWHYRKGGLQRDELEARRWALAEVARVIRDG